MMRARNWRLEMKEILFEFVKIKKKKKEKKEFRFEDQMLSNSQSLTCPKSDKK